MAPRKKPQRTKTVRVEDYTPLEIHAIQVREWYLALRKAGFDSASCLTLCVDPQGWPDWFGLPNKSVEDIGTIIEDEDDD